MITYDFMKIHLTPAMANKLFGNLRSLKALHLRFNNSMELTKNTFGDSFGKLEILSISGYQLKTLPSRIFNKIKNLTVLQITQGYLTSLPPDDFESLRNLEILDLSFNKLTTLDM